MIKICLFFHVFTLLTHKKSFTISSIRICGNFQSLVKRNYVLKPTKNAMKFSSKAIFDYIV